MEKWYNTKEVAEKLGVTPGTVQDYCKEGVMKATKDPGGKWRVSESALQEYLTGEKPNQTSGALAKAEEEAKIAQFNRDKKLAEADIEAIDDLTAREEAVREKEKALEHRDNFLGEEARKVISLEKEQLNSETQKAAVAKEKYLTAVKAYEDTNKQQAEKIKSLEKKLDALTTVSQRWLKEETEKVDTRTAYLGGHLEVRNRIMVARNYLVKLDEFGVNMAGSLSRLIAYLDRIRQDQYLEEYADSGVETIRKAVRLIMLSAEHYQDASGRLGGFLSKQPRFDYVAVKDRLIDFAGEIEALLVMPDPRDNPDYIYEMTDTVKPPAEVEQKQKE